MKKKILIIISGILFLVVILGIVSYLRVKNAKVMVKYVSNREVSYGKRVYVKDFIISINGKLIDNKLIDTTKLGEKKVNYKYINDDGIKVKMSFSIDVVDKEAPIIWVSNTYNIKLGSEEALEDIIMCGDNYDKKPKCSIKGDYDINKVGKYNLVYEAIDTNNNKTSKKFTLNVYEDMENKKEEVSKKVTLFSDVRNNYKTDNTEVGIDISKWQGDVDFKKLKEANVEFVMIRIGTSKGLDGENVLDSKFLENIKNANKEGIKVGLYFYSLASSNKKAIEDAKWIIDIIKNGGYKVEMPIAFDWENWKYFNLYNVSFYGLSSIAKSFMDTIKESGYESILYSSKTYLDNIWYDVGYPIWLAHYTSKTSFEGHSMWQICNNGRVDGINVDVDIDIRYLF